MAVSLCFHCFHLLLLLMAALDLAPPSLPPCSRIRSSLLPKLSMNHPLRNSPRFRALPPEV
ncbi:unnamed protein product [Brassica oleracea]